MNAQNKSQKKPYNKANRRRNGGKDNKTNNKPDATDRNTVTEMETVKSNNIAWWNKSVTYADANRIPFNTIPGYVYPLSDFSPDDRVYTHAGLTPDEIYAQSIPGIMSIDYYAFTGPASNWNDPLNKSWMSIFSAYASKTSGSFQIQQADLALVGEAANSIIVNIYEMKRLLGMAHLFSNVNQYLPKSLIQAAGFRPDSILGHEDDIRRELNYYIGAFNTLNLPGYTDMHLRRAQLAHNVYADEDSIRAQFALFRSKGYYQYIDTADAISDAEHLQFIPWSDMENRTADQLLDAIAKQINSLRDSASFGLVSAAVLRAFGDRQLLRIEFEPIDSILVPTYDRNMNYQIQNAEFAGTLDVDTLHVTVNVVGNALECIPRMDITTTMNHGFPSTMSQKVLNSYDGNFDDEFVMEATRLKFSSTALSDPQWSPSAYTMPIDICGTEICHSYKIWNMRQVNDDAAPELLSTKAIASFFQADDAMQVAKTVSDIAKFRFHPTLWLIYVEPVTKTFKQFMFNDLYTWTRLDITALRGLHEAALQSIYTLNPAIEVGNKI